MSIDISPLVLVLIVVVLVIAAAGEVIYAWAERRGWRFSVRALLIATTLVAVVLGLIVWLR